MSLHSVLFVAYNFPPHGGAGVQRSVKFVKYLPCFGWQPLVLTTTADASHVQDPSLWHDLPSDLPVWRTPGFSIARLQARLAHYHLEKAAVAVNLLLQVPDAARFWASRTRSAVAQIVESEMPELIYTTSGPYSSHLLGMWARHQFGIPWFADFRDPWSQNLLIPYLPGYRALNRRIERQVLASADRVACVSEPWLDDLRANLGVHPEKFLVLPNGYDEADVQPLPSPAKTDRFTLMHLGSFYRNRRPDVLLEAVKLLIGSCRIPVSDLRVVFIGGNARRHIPDVPPYQAMDYVPHRDLARFRAQASAFALVLATSPENVGNHSGKLFEYLASNRPILGVVPPGGVAEQLIVETRTGIAVNGDAKAVADAIETLYHEWRSGAPDWDPNWDLIRQYNRRNLTERLAAEFDGLLRSRAVR